MRHTQESWTAAPRIANYRRCRKDTRRKNRTRIYRFCSFKKGDEGRPICSRRQKYLCLKRGVRAMLSEQIMSLLRDGCGKAFVQERSRVRAMELSLGTLCALGRRTLSRSICAIGRQHQDWSADYKVFSRSHWEPDRLFVPVLKEYRERDPPQTPFFASLSFTTKEKRREREKQRRSRL